MQQFADAALAQHQAAGIACTDNGVEHRTAEIVAILGEISELSRQHRRQEEELREERRALAEERRSVSTAQAALRADRVGIDEAHRRVEAERHEVKAARMELVSRAKADEAAESKRSVTAELQSELEQERRNTEAQRRASEAMKCLYQRMIDEKDQELRDQLERAASKDRIKEARIRELTQQLHSATEAAATRTAPPASTTAEAAVEPMQAEAASTSRRRLSFSGDCNGPPFAAQEEPVAFPSLRLDATQVRSSDVAPPSAPPSAGGGPMTSDARRRLSYTVGTQTPETPYFDPTLSEMAQRLFDLNNSQLEAANSTIIADTPGASVSVAFAPIDELSMLQEAAPTAFALTPTVLTEAMRVPALPSPIVNKSATPRLLEPQPAPVPVNRCLNIPPLALVEHSGTSPAVPVNRCLNMPPLALVDHSGTPPAHQGLPATFAHKAAGPPGATAKAACKALPRLKVCGAIQRASSERPHSARSSDRAPWSPSNISPRRSESARPAPELLATPPRVQKESPPRGCVAGMVNLFEQRCQTPVQSAPEALRRGPYGGSVPTPTSAGAHQTRLWHAEAWEEAEPLPRSARGVLGLPRA